MIKKFKKFNKYYLSYKIHNQLVRIKKEVRNNNKNKII